MTLGVMQDNHAKEYLTNGHRTEYLNNGNTKEYLRNGHTNEYLPNEHTIANRHTREYLPNGHPKNGNATGYLANGYTKEHPAYFHNKEHQTNKHNKEFQINEHNREYLTNQKTEQLRNGNTKNYLTNGNSPYQNYDDRSTSMSSFLSDERPIFANTRQLHPFPEQHNKQIFQQNQQFGINQFSSLNPDQLKREISQIKKEDDPPCKVYPHPNFLNPSPLLNHKQSITDRNDEKVGFDQLHRLTPEIVEPRTSFFESENDLKKKIKPFLKDGMLQQLPGFNTFCDTLNETTAAFKDLKQSSPAKAKLVKSKKQQKRTTNRGKDNSTKFSCGCTVQNADASPFYYHLGSARSIKCLEEKLSNQFGVEKDAIRIVQVSPTSTEGKNGDGCPMARWVLRRTNEAEKYLVAVKRSSGHTCEHQYTVVIIVAWEGIAKQYADDMYEYLRQQLNHSGYKTRRRCGSNDSKTCMCQGEDEETQGASFTFGCSWSMFFDGCKFAKSKAPRKYKMQDPKKEDEMEQLLQDMATNVSPLLNIWAPQAFHNMTNFEHVASDCRVGRNEGRPFSGVTCCMDFCAHSHKDLHNMNNGTTMVCTLLRPNYDARDDEQLHVLPLYQLLGEDGKVAQPNYNIPSHLMKSKIQDAQKQPECKGRYVCPEAVHKKGTVEKVEKIIEKSSENNQNDQEMKMVKNPFDQIYPCYTNENSIPLLRTENLVQQQNEYNSIDNKRNIKPVFQDEHQIPLFTNEWRNKSMKIECEDNFKSTLESLSNKAEPNGIPTTESAPSTPNTPSTPSAPKTRRKKPFISRPTVITEDMGGVAIALGHGSFLVECARKELHATTALKNPQRDTPTRISMVYYQHKKLNDANHGYFAYKEKVRAKLVEREMISKQSSLDDLNLFNFESSLLNDSNMSIDSNELSMNTSLEKCDGKLTDKHSNSAPDIPSLVNASINQTNISYSYIPMSDSVQPMSDSVQQSYVNDVNTIDGQNTNKSFQTHDNANKLLGVKNIVRSLTSEEQQKGTVRSLTTEEQLPTFSVFSSQFGNPLTSERDSNELVNQTSRETDKQVVNSPNEHGLPATLSNTRKREYSAAGLNSSPNPLLMLSNAAKDFDPSDYALDSKSDCNLPFRRTFNPPIHNDRRILNAPFHNDPMSFNQPMHNDRVKFNSPVHSENMRTFHPPVHKQYKKWSVASILEDDKEKQKNAALPTQTLKVTKDKAVEIHSSKIKTFEKHIHQPTILDQHAAMFAGISNEAYRKTANQAEQITSDKRSEQVALEVFQPQTNGNILGMPNDGPENRPSQNVDQKNKFFPKQNVTHLSNKNKHQMHMSNISVKDTLPDNQESNVINQNLPKNTLQCTEHRSSPSRPPYFIPNEHRTSPHNQSNFIKDENQLCNRLNYKTNEHKTLPYTPLNYKANEYSSAYRHIKEENPSPYNRYKPKDYHSSPNRPSNFITDQHHSSPYSSLNYNLNENLSAAYKSVHSELRHSSPYQPSNYMSAEQNSPYKQPNYIKDEHHQSLDYKQSVYMKKEHQLKLSNYNSNQLQHSRVDKASNYIINERKNITENHLYHSQNLHHAYAQQEVFSHINAAKKHLLNGVSNQLMHDTNPLHNHLTNVDARVLEHAYQSMQSDKFNQPTYH